MPEVRAKAAFALGGFGDDARGAVTDLVPLLQDKDAPVRASAAAGLGEIGPAARRPARPSASR